MPVDRLTLGELANIWVDEPIAPFHIALAAEFDAGPFLRDDGTVDTARVRAELVGRAKQVPALRRRIVRTRFGQGRPSWADDPAFTPERHVTCAALPNGVTFTDWCAPRILRPLDLDRPPWRAEIVDVLPGNRFGVLIVIHHVIADGITGVALAAALLDPPPPAPTADPGPAQPRSPRPGLDTAADRPQSVPERARRGWQRLAQAAADLRSRAPRTSLSRPIDPQRRLGTVQLPLPDLREAGHRLGVTVNDLLLAAITGGLRDLLQQRGDDVAGLELRASVPVGVRGPGQRTGILLVGLPVGEPDPLRRLAAIHNDTAARKAALRAGGGAVTDVLRLPTPAARLAVRWMRRIAGRGINLFVTNVPGPEQPLALAGARLLAAVPVAPLVRGVPLGIAALSYAGTLHVSVNADAAVTDLHVLTAGIQRTAAALLDAARAGAELPAAPESATDLRGVPGVIENAIGIDRDPETVFGYCTDPLREPEWNPQLLAVEKLTDGPLGAGTRYRMRFGHGAGDSTVIYTGFDPPRSWAAASSSPRLEVRTEGQAVPTNSGSRLVVRTELRPRGPLRPLAPLLRRYMHHAWDRNLTVIKAQLENRRDDHPEAPGAGPGQPVRHHS